MPDDEVRDKKPDLLAHLVKNVLGATKEIYEIPSDEQQEGQGVKILTPKQLITRLPILLAQLKSGNNSQKLKNEIRQLSYSLYRSKKLGKTIYNSLMNAI